MRVMPSFMRSCNKNQWLSKSFIPFYFANHRERVITSKNSDRELVSYTVSTTRLADSQLTAIVLLDLNLI